MSVTEGGGEARGAEADDHLNPLLERDSELALIETVLSRVAAGAGRRLLIEGPAGIGKSALFEFACRRGRELGMLVLATEASEMGLQLALGVARDLLDDAEGSVGVDTGRAEHGPGEQPPAVSARLAQAVFELATTSPVMIAVDDVQWADAGSLRWLAELARHVARAPVALLVAARSGTAEERGSMLAALLDDRRAVVLRPAPLSAEAAGDLLARSLGRAPTSALVEAAQHETAGNPYLLRAIGEALRQAGRGDEADEAARVRELGSRAVAGSVGNRLDELDRDARALVEASATVGAVDGVAELAAIAGVDPVRAADAAQRLVAADLLRSADPPELTHPLVRSAIRSAVGAERREGLLRAAARRLADSGRTEEAAARLVELSARADPGVAETLAEAAARAAARGAPEVAASLLRRALAEPPSPERMPALRAALGETLLALADPGAIAVLEHALGEMKDAPKRAEIARALALALVLDLRIGEAADVLERARDQVRVDDPTLAEELEAQALHYASLDPTLRERRVRRLRALGEDRGASELAYRMRLVEIASESLGACRPATETAALLERALAGGTLLSRAPDVHLSAALLLAYAGRPKLARTQLQDAISSARETGQVALLSFALGIHGEVLWREGDLVAAETDLRAALELVSYRELGTPFIARPLLETLLEQGETAAAEAELRRAGLTGELPDVLSRAAILHARGRVRAAAGALRMAVDAQRLAGESLERFGMDSPASVPWRRAAALALLGLGEREEAVALSAAEVALAGQIQAPEVLGPALRVHGLALGGADGREALERAVAMLASSSARLEHARAQVELGTVLRGDGEPARARSLLADAAALAEDLGATTLAQRATSELTLAGGRPRRAEARGARALTPAERRVASLAAQGLTNREVAETLVLATKTIETHLASAYRKLGIRARGELAPALAAVREPAARPGSP